jgi:hypothetical protein
VRLHMEPNELQIQPGFALQSLMTSSSGGAARMRADTMRKD